MIGAESTGATAKQVNSYRQKHGLCTAGRERPRTQAELAYLLTWRDGWTAKDLGVTEFERREYRRRWSVLEKGLPAGIDKAHWSGISADVNTWWEDLDLHLEAPPELLGTT